MKRIYYSHTPPCGDKVSRALTVALIALAAVLLVLGELFASLKPIFQAAGFGALLLAVLFCTRFLLSGYTYSIELSDDGEEGDLVITENRGKARRTVCRVSVKGARLSRPQKKQSGRVYDYRPSPFIAEHYLFEVSERDGGGFIRFCPDEKIVNILRSLGCEVEE